jgi:hypothetical protein
MKLFRKYYISGIFSLVFLPILCIWYFEKRDAFKKEYILPVCFWNKNLKNQYGYEAYNIDGSIQKMKYNKLILSNNPQSIQKISEIIQTFKRTKNSLIGLHIIFSTDMKFENYIKLLDIINSEKIRCFAPTEKEIWIHNYPENIIEKESEYISPPCGGDLYYITEEMKLYNSIRKYIQIQKQNIQTAWYFKYSIGLFVLMLFAKQITKFSTRFY